MDIVTCFAFFPSESSPKAAEGRMEAKITICTLRFDSLVSMV